MELLSVIFLRRFEALDHGGPPNHNCHCRECTGDGQILEQMFVRK